MAKLWLPDDFEIPKECNECPFQLKYKDGEVDDWYTRRCVIMGRTIEYPKPKWCPIIDDIKVMGIQR